MSAGIQEASLGATWNQTALTPSSLHLARELSSWLVTWSSGQGEEAELTVSPAYRSLTPSNTPSLALLVILRLLRLLFWLRIFWSSLLLNARDASDKMWPNTTSCGQLLSARFCKTCTHCLSSCTLTRTGFMDPKQIDSFTKLEISLPLFF